LASKLSTIQAARNSSCKEISCGDRPDAAVEIAFGVLMAAFRLGNPQWQRHLVLGDGWRIFVRPIRPDDDLLIRDLLAHVSKEDLRLRFFDSIKEFSHQFIASLTQLDYARAMAFVAIDEVSSETLGVVRLHTDSSREAGEYAILLRSDLKGRGLGWALMQLIIEYAKSQGLSRIDGQILQENSVMLKMCRELGFEIKTDAEDTTSLSRSPQTRRLN
jgi:acetyltransferase